jgi:hypothetical protein
MSVVLFAAVVAYAEIENPSHFRLEFSIHTKSAPPACPCGPDCNCVDCRCGGGPGGALQPVTRAADIPQPMPRYRGPNGEPLWNDPDR